MHSTVQYSRTQILSKPRLDEPAQCLLMHATESRPFLLYSVRRWVHTKLYTNDGIKGGFVGGAGAWMDK
jgi:hypothetical protein